ncbi:MAG: DNA-3-methyladenine glycosylase [Pseudomonadota bacterium]|nr:DNA-3-methyladenine glycosylase [Pseudomonadota bacterium]
MGSSEKLNKSSNPPYWDKARRHLLAVDPVLATIIKKCGPGKLVARNDGFFSLARSIVGQQISVKAAQSIWNKLEQEVGVISPERLMGKTGLELRKCGVTRQKSAYLLDLAHHFTKGSLREQNWEDLDDDQVANQVTQVKGIGPWTAEMFLMFHLLRPDILPVGDVGIQNAMKLHFNQDKQMTAEEIIARAEPWRPWRSVASWYLWRSLDPLPVDY